MVQYYSSAYGGGTFEVSGVHVRGDYPFYFDRYHYRDFLQQPDERNLADRAGDDDSFVYANAVLV